jgi:hypothetical protein
VPLRNLQRDAVGGHSANPKRRGSRVWMNRVATQKGRSAAWSRWSSERSLLPGGFAECSLLLGEIFDELEEIVASVALAAGELNELLSFAENDALGDSASGDVDASAALEFQEAFVA